MADKEGEVCRGQSPSHQIILIVLADSGCYRGAVFVRQFQRVGGRGPDTKRLWIRRCEILERLVYKSTRNCEEGDACRVSLEPYFGGSSWP